MGDDHQDKEFIRGEARRTFTRALAAYDAQEGSQAFDLFTEALKMMSTNGFLIYDKPLFDALGTTSSVFSNFYQDLIADQARASLTVALDPDTPAEKVAKALSIVDGLVKEQTEGASQNEAYCRLGFDKSEYESLRHNLLVACAKTALAASVEQAAADGQKSKTSYDEALSYLVRAGYEQIENRYARVPARMYESLGIDESWFTRIKQESLLACARDYLAFAQDPHNKINQRHIFVRDAVRMISESGFPSGSSEPYERLSTTAADVRSLKKDIHLEYARHLIMLAADPAIYAETARGRLITADEHIISAGFTPGSPKAFEALEISRDTYNQIKSDIYTRCAQDRLIRAEDPKTPPKQARVDFEMAADYLKDTGHTPGTPEACAHLAITPEHYNALAERIKNLEPCKAPRPT